MERVRHLTGGDVPQGQGVRMEQLRVCRHVRGRSHARTFRFRSKPVGSRQAQRKCVLLGRLCTRQGAFRDEECAR